jgi:hypothetical protein
MNTVFVCCSKAPARRKFVMYFFTYEEIVFYFNMHFWDIILNFYNVVQLKRNVLNGFIPCLN